MNYEKKVMIQCFNILTRKDFEWTEDFSLEMRNQFLDLLLNYFTDIEHYEKCAIIVKKKQSLEIMNENISKTTVTGSEES